ncbi:hypothetical protein ACFLYA_01965 [Candidatus Dependentiae bacterium]
MKKILLALAVLTMTVNVFAMIKEGEEALVEIKKMIKEKAKEEKNENEIEALVKETIGLLDKKYKIAILDVKDGWVTSFVVVIPEGYDTKIYEIGMDFVERDKKDEGAVKKITILRRLGRGTKRFSTMEMFIFKGEDLNRPIINELADKLKKALHADIMRKASEGIMKIKVFKKQPMSPLSKQE